MATVGDERVPARMAAGGVAGCSARWQGCAGAGGRWRADGSCRACGGGSSPIKMRRSSRRNCRRQRRRSRSSQPTVRSEFADTALWVAALETNNDGIAEVELDMPENLTAWKIRVWGWATARASARRRAEVVTRKNLIVRLQAPRFFVEKDEVVLSANVHNYLPTAKQVKVRLELDGNTLELPSRRRADRSKFPPAASSASIGA